MRQGENVCVCVSVFTPGVHLVTQVAIPLKSHWVSTLPLGPHVNPQADDDAYEAPNTNKRSRPLGSSAVPLERRAEQRRPVQSKAAAAEKRRAQVRARGTAGVLLLQRLPSSLGWCHV